MGLEVGKKLDFEMGLNEHGVPSRPVGEGLFPTGSRWHLLAKNLGVAGLTQYCLRETFQKKNIDSVSMLIPRGGGPQASAHTSLGVFFACFKPTCLALGSPKTNFVFTPSSKIHIFSDLFDHQNKPSQL